MTPRRRAVHKASETAALVVGVPFLLWAASVTPHPVARVGLSLLAFATAAVDGWLLSKWKSENARR